MKDFEAILSDYEFFCAHSNEKKANLEILSRFIKERSWGKKVRILDFGCGPGDFLFDLVELSMDSKQALEINLVEPSSVYRKKAKKVFLKRRNVEINDWKEFDSTRKGRYDLIIANHVLYYVKDKAKLLESFSRAAHSETLILVTLSGARNGLNALTRYANELAGIELPYRTFEEFEGYLRSEKINHDQHPMNAELRFVDTAENRAKIVRFVLGQSATLVLGTVSAFLDHYKVGKEIVIPLEDIVFQVTPRFEAVAHERRKTQAA